MDYGRRKLRLGDILVNHRIISAEQLKEALELQKTEGKKLGEVLVSTGICSEESIASALSSQLNIEMVLFID